MRRVDHDAQQFFEWRIDIDEIHAWRGHHHVAGRHVGHANHAFEHHARVGADDVVAFRFGQGFDQLFWRIGAGMDELHHFLQECALVFLFRRSRGVRV